MLREKLEYNTYSCLSVSTRRTASRVSIVEQQPVNSWTTIQPLHMAANDNWHPTMLSLLYGTKRTYRVRILANAGLHACRAQLVENCTRTIQLKCTTDRLII